MKAATSRGAWWILLFWCAAEVASGPSLLAQESTLARGFPGRKVAANANGGKPHGASAQPNGPLADAMGNVRQLFAEEAGFVDNGNNAALPMHGGLGSLVSAAAHQGVRGTALAAYIHELLALKHQVASQAPAGKAKGSPNAGGGASAGHVKKNGHGGGVLGFQQVQGNNGSSSQNCGSSKHSGNSSNSSHQSCSAIKYSGGGSGSTAKNGGFSRSGGSRGIGSSPGAAYVTINGNGNTVTINNGTSAKSNKNAGTNPTALKTPGALSGKNSSPQNSSIAITTPTAPLAPPTTTNNGVVSTVKTSGNNTSAKSPGSAVGSKTTGKTTGNGSAQPPLVGIAKTTGNPSSPNQAMSTPKGPATAGSAKTVAVAPLGTTNFASPKTTGQIKTGSPMQGVAKGGMAGQQFPGKNTAQAQHGSHRPAGAPLHVAVNQQSAFNQGFFLSRTTGKRK